MKRFLRALWGVARRLAEPVGIALAACAVLGLLFWGAYLIRNWMPWIALGVVAAMVLTGIVKALLWLWNAWAEEWHDALRGEQ